MQPKKKKRRGILTIAVILIMLLTSPVFAGQEPNIKYGLWEVTVKIEMAGMPMQMPPMTTTQCITKENMVPDSSQPGQECQMVERKLSGDTMTWKMECNTDQGKMDATGEVTYAGDSFDGSMKMNMQGMTMTQKMSGKWIGECN